MSEQQESLMMKMCQEIKQGQKILKNKKKLNAERIETDNYRYTEVLWYRLF
ncbi:MAG: hypothetical protein KatS3mg002_1525 [Candidatus Woesearchaeota archaeon]|nr:MAG: hypothetical protein KatS3mg002_1525 [Candidatus Woesearchaeota archaeon]